MVDSVAPGECRHWIQTPALKCQAAIALKEREDKVKALILLIVVSSIILTYGYWHSITHASFYVSLHAAEASDGKISPTPAGAVEFLSSSGTVLASGVLDRQYNFVRLIHPEHGDCHEVEKMAAFSKDARNSWQQCFEHLSVWIATWIRDVKTVNLEYGDCVIQGSPLTISKSRSDWFLWWFPHPHIGGNPYSDYSAAITVNQEDCN
jgi:hypothetical protein